MVGLPLTVTASDMVSANVSVSPCLPTTLSEPPPALLSVTLKLLTDAGVDTESMNSSDTDKLRLSVAVTLTVRLTVDSGVPLKVRLAASNVNQEGNALPSDSVAV